MDNRGNELITGFETLLYLVGRQYQGLERDTPRRSVRHTPDSREALRQALSRILNNEKVDVAILVGDSVCVGAEQNNLLWSIPGNQPCDNGVEHGLNVVTPALIPYFRR